MSQSQLQAVSSVLMALSHQGCVTYRGEILIQHTHLFISCEALWPLRPQNMVVGALGHRPVIDSSFIWCLYAFHLMVLLSYRPPLNACVWRYLISHRKYWNTWQQLDLSAAWWPVRAQHIASEENTCKLMKPWQKHLHQFDSMGNTRQPNKEHHAAQETTDMVFLGDTKMMDTHVLPKKSPFQSVQLSITFLCPLETSPSAVIGATYFVWMWCEWLHFTCRFYF